MVRRRAFVFIAALASVPLLVACGGGTTASGGTSSGAAPASSGAAPASGGTGGPQVVTINGLDAMKFDPGAVAVKAGQPVQITLVNQGQTLHDVTIADGVPKKMALLAEAGKQASGTLTFDRPGAYAFVCEQPGHQAAGMKGTITVQ